jgi:hypothetical protein
MSTSFHTAHRSRFQGCAPQSLAFVSATTFGVEAEVRGIVRPNVPNYAIRRLLVGSVALGLAVVGLAAAVGLFAGFQGTRASASGVQSALADTAVSAAIHVAQPGDTLWSIADIYRGDISRNRYIDVLIGINGDTGVISGEAIWLP